MGPALRVVRDGDPVSGVRPVQSAHQSGVMRRVSVGAASHAVDHGNASDDAEGDRGDCSAPWQVRSKVSAVRAPYAAALDSAIREAGVSDEAIGRRLGMPRQHVGQMRRGDRPIELHHYEALPSKVKTLLRPLVKRVFGDTHEERTR